MSGQYRYAAKIENGNVEDVSYETIKICGEYYETLKLCEEHAKSFLQMNREVKEVIITRDIMKIELTETPFEITKYE